MRAPFTESSTDRQSMAGQKYSASVAEGRVTFTSGDGTVRKTFAINGASGNAQFALRLGVAP